METIKNLQDKYGKEVFGLVVFLVIWFGVVKPHMDQNRIDAQAQATMVAALERTSDNLKEVASRLERLESRQ